MEKHCENCGNVIPEDSPTGACPVCALKSAFSSEGDLEGRVIGRYTIIEQIGKGGFGVVYLASQSTPVRRQVAVKILNRSNIGKYAAGQFIAEQQALALMNHPNIAKIFDAGETDWGVPYFVMELVVGEPITTYCDRKKLNPKERIGIFREVCSAVQHAHQKAIIHRDLKPANILVEELDDRPIPKVIDFGVAKAMGAPLANMTFDLRSGQVIGTLEYMPPEQARGDSDIDTRADIYSLGVLLYELLIGSPPFSRRDLEEVGLDAILRKIENDPPPSPSERLSLMQDEVTSIADDRHIAPGKLLKMVRGDLDWIVMKAMEKPRKWRYDTAGAMATDIDCYLENRPLPSRRKTLAYRARKFVRRNRLLVTSATTILTILLIGLSAGWTIRAKHAREKAEGYYQTLLDCRIERLPSVVADIQPYYRLLDGHLGEMARDENAKEESRARARILLLPHDAAQLEPIGEWLFQAPPGALGIYIGLLDAHRGGLGDIAWEALLDKGAPSAKRLHAAAICAALDPTNMRWKNLADQVASWLVEGGTLGSLRWIPLLEPIAIVLESPLQQIYADEKAGRSKEVAAVALAEFLKNSPEALLDLAGRADRYQLGHVAEAMSRQAETVEPVMAAQLAAPRPAAGDEAENRIAAARQAHLGLALMLMQRPVPVWSALQHHPDPELRSALIHGLAEYDIDPATLIKQLALPELDPGALSAILIALGDYDSARIPPSARAGMKTQLEQLYTTHPDPGVHASAEWLLREWKMDQDLAKLDPTLRSGAPLAARNWFVTRGGDFTLSILPQPITFEMGSPPGESGRLKNEHEHTEQIERRVAIALKEVTVEQFMRFAKELQIKRRKDTAKEAAADPWHGLESLRPTPQSAMCSITLKEAVVFCWWLSRNEGIPAEDQCYEFPEDTLFDAADPVVREGFLTKGGYRLPTEAEWEFACRGGTTGPRYFGTSPDLLPKYAWLRSNANNVSRPPGLLRPNPYGLFDILGNVTEWCQEPYQEAYLSDPTGKSATVTEVITLQDPAEGRWPVYRGGSFMHPAKYLRSAWRNSTPYANQPFTSFRLARTIKN